MAKEKKASFPCDICQKTFTNQGNLNRHAVVHTGKKPFSCSECGKSFNRKDSLDTHMLLHSEDNPFHCKTCSKTYTSRHNLMLHETSHSGEKLHTCPQCFKGTYCFFCAILGSLFRQLFCQLNKKKLVFRSEASL